MTRGLGLLIVGLLLWVAAPSVGVAEEAGEEAQFVKIMDDMIAAFKEQDCDKAAGMLEAVDLAAMQSLSARLKKKYPDAPPPKIKAKLAAMEPPMQASLGQCMENASYKAAFDKLVRAMK